MADKVSAELDNTLKFAVKEKVEIKRELDKMKDEKEATQKEY